MAKQDTPKYQTWANKFYFRGEINTMPSETLPDQSMSIIEILRRFTDGRPLTEIGKIPKYAIDENGEIDPINSLPDLSRMDLADRQEFLEKVSQEVEQIKKRQNDRRKQEEDDATKRKWFEAFQKQAADTAKPDGKDATAGDTGGAPK